MSMAENGAATAKLWKKQGRTQEEALAYCRTTKENIKDLKKELDVKLDYIWHVQAEIESMEWD